MPQPAGGMGGGDPRDRRLPCPDAYTGGQSRRWIWPVAAVLGGAVLFAGGFYLRERTLQQEPPSFQRLTFRRGLLRNARFSSDGHSVVYTANWEGAKAHTFLSIPGDPESRDLNLPEDSLVLAVSSNSEVAFLEPPFSSDDGSGTLARGSLSGGQMRPQLDGVTVADWSPDGSSLAVLRQVNGRARLEYPIGKVVYEFPEKYPFFTMRISPDGKRIAYMQPSPMARRLASASSTCPIASRACWVWFPAKRSLSTPPPFAGLPMAARSGSAPSIPMNGARFMPSISKVARAWFIAFRVTPTSSISPATAACSCAPIPLRWASSPKAPGINRARSLHS